MVEYTSLETGEQSMRNIIGVIILTILTGYLLYIMNGNGSNGSEGGGEQLGGGGYLSGIAGNISSAMGMDLDEKAHKAAQKRGFSWDINKPDPDYDYTSVVDAMRHTLGMDKFPDFVMNAYELGMIPGTGSQKNTEDFINNDVIAAAFAAGLNAEQVMDIVGKEATHQTKGFIPGHATGYPFSFDRSKTGKPQNRIGVTGVPGAADPGNMGGAQGLWT